MSTHRSHISNWKMVKLGEVTEIIKGGTPSRNVEKYFQGNIAWAIPSDITALDSFLYIDDTETHITEEALNNSAARLLPAGTVLLTSRATIGETAIATVRMATNQGFANFVCNEKLLNVFLAYYLRYIKEKLNDLASGSTFKEVTKGTLLNIEIPFLPLEEQRAIAEVLSDVDGLLKALDALIAKKRAIKQAIMQQLLTGKTRLPGLSGAWERKQLGDLFSIRVGSSKSQYIRQDGRYIIVDMGAVATDGRLIVSKYTDYEGDFLKEGDLVMPKDDIGGGKIIGKAAYISANNLYVLGDHVYALRLIEGFPKFFSYLINRYETNSSLKSKVGGSAQLGLSRKAVEEQEVPVPTREEQIAITAVLSDIDAEITTLEQRRDKTTAIKQGMMQQLLTGRVRLFERRIDSDNTDYAD